MSGWRRLTWVLWGVMSAGIMSPAVMSAQEARLVSRLSEAARPEVDAVLDSARATGTPTEPLVDRALEGAAKGASDERILAAVRRLWAELGVARTAFGDSALAAELRAGASALRAGATRSDLKTLRARRPNRPLIVAAGVLADLVAVGVPSDTAIAAVLALAEDAGDGDYIAFRRNVESDIALGASPAAALAVRLRVATELTGVVAGAAAADAGSPAAPPGKRKP